MNLEDKLNGSFNEILRTSGYIFEIINNNKKQSNLITGPNNQLIPPPIVNQLSQKIAHFESILDETVIKFNDVPWCISQILENKKKQEEQKLQDELERQRKVEAERKRKEEEDALARKNKEEEEKLARDKAEKAGQAEANNATNGSRGGQPDMPQSQDHEQFDDMEGFMNSDFDLNLDMGKGLDIPNPSDILSSINHATEGENMASTGQQVNASRPTGAINLDLNSPMKGGSPSMDDFNMDLLGPDFDEGLGGAVEDDFDVDNFLTQLGGGE